MGAAELWVATVTGCEAPGFETEESVHEWLKSGERLCELVNTIKPGSVPRITRSAMPFRQMENISAYLDACQELGVPKFELFMTVDLFEAKSMGAVIRNIHSLGRIAQTVDGFDGPTLGARLATKAERHFSEAQLAEARAMPSRWTNRGMAGGAAGAPSAAEASAPAPPLSPSAPKPSAPPPVNAQSTAYEPPTPHDTGTARGAAAFKAVLGGGMMLGGSGFLPGKEPSVRELMARSSSLDDDDDFDGKPRKKPVLRNGKWVMEERAEHEQRPTGFTSLEELKASNMSKKMSEKKIDAFKITAKTSSSAESSASSAAPSSATASSSNLRSPTGASGGAARGEYG